MPVKKFLKTAPSVIKKTISNDIILADEPLSPETDFNKLTGLFHGPRKIGKTSLLAEWPDPYFLMFEPGAKFLRLRQSACDDFATFLKILDKLEQKPKGYAQNYVLDTGFKMYEHCFRWTVEDLHLTDIRDDAWGNGWTEVNKRFLEANERILALGAGYLATAHTETEERVQRGGGKYNVTVTQLSKQAKRWFASFVDIIGYIHYDNLGNRLMQIRGDAELEAGCRPPEHFNYTNGNPISSIDMGKTPRAGFENFWRAFNNDLIQPGGILKKTILTKV